MLYEINQLPRRRGFHSDFMNGFLGKDIFSDYQGAKEETSAKGAFPATNIVEYKEEFNIELAAPGLCREDYEIILEKDRLKVVSNKQAESKNEEANYTRREYAYGEFERTFILPENVNKEKISASCADGILTIHIPKKTLDSRPEKRTISVK